MEHCFGKTIQIDVGLHALWRQLGCQERWMANSGVRRLSFDRRIWWLETVKGSFVMRRAPTVMIPATLLMLNAEMTTSVQYIWRQWTWNKKKKSGVRYQACSERWYQVIKKKKNLDNLTHRVVNLTDTFLPKSDIWPCETMSTRRVNNQLGKLQNSHKHKRWESGYFSPISFWILANN